MLASDQTTNFPTRPAYDANGNPASLTATPVAGTTFLTESFDTGSSSGSASTTWAVAEGEDDNLLASTLHSSYTGKRGARYNYANTVAVTDASGTNTDTVTWQVSRLSTGSYGGGQDTDLTYSGDAQSGTNTLRNNANGQSTVSASLTDVYLRTGRTKQANGTLQVSTADLTPSTYNIQQTEQQVYTGGVLTTDTLTSSAASYSLTKQSLNDTWDFTTKVLKDDGTLLGTTVGTQYTGSADTTQTQASAASTLNLLDNTATVNSSNSSSDAGWTMKAASGTYTAADGSVIQAAGWVRATQGFSSTSTNAQGDLNAEGAQTSGTLATQSQDGGIVYGFSTQLYQGTGWPTLYTVQTKQGGYADGSSSDLTANSDDSANGTVQAGAASTTVIDTTATMTGTQALSDGTAAYDNYNHTKETVKLAAAADLFMSSGLANGTTTQESDDLNSLDYRIKVKIDRTGDKLHATLKGSGSGSNETDDTVTAAYASGTPTLSRTFMFSQKGTTESNLSASGKLSDSAGHTGSWSLQQSASGSTDDRVDVALSQGAQGWVETGRTFRINDQSGSSSSFSESDDGLGQPAFPAGQIGGYTHSNNANTESATTVIRDGTSASYTFTTNRRGLQTQQDSTSWAWLNPATGDGGSKQTLSSSTRAFRNNVTGTDTGGQRSLTSRDTYTHAEDLTKSHLVYYVANELRLEVTQALLVDVTEQRRGSAASGTGTRRLYVSNLNKVSSYVEGQWRTTGAEPQTQSSVLDLSWPNGQSPTTWDVIWEDFKNEPAVRWLRLNGASVLRIGFGLVDVVSGAMLTLGSWGTGVVPGVGLMALGVDQIVTGAVNLANPQSQTGSVVEFGGASAARGLGFGEQASQLIGDLTPLALSLGFAGWGAMGRSAFPAKIFHHSDKVATIAGAGRMFGRTEGRVYGTLFGRLNWAFADFWPLSPRDSPSF